MLQYFWPHTVIGKMLKSNFPFCDSDQIAMSSHNVQTSLFSSPGHTPCELLSWVSVHRPSVSFSHLTLLL